MYKKGNIFNRLKKIEDNLDFEDAKDIKTEMIILDTDNKYYKFDNEGKRIPISEQEYNNINFDSKGRIKGHKQILVQVVDNEYLESVLYSDID